MLISLPIVHFAPRQRGTGDKKVLVLGARGPYKLRSMKTNFLHRLKSNARTGEKCIESKSELTILLLLFVALALAGCEGMESGSSGGASPWPAAPIGSSAPPASQTGFASALNGQWYHDGKPTSIKVDPDGRHLTIIDENGFRTNGVANSPYEFDVRGLKGSVDHGGRRISWSNGGTWTREPQQRGSNSGAAPGQQGISGRWYHDGKPTSISVSPAGSVTITDENGITTSGHMMNASEFMTSGLLRGSVSPDGRRISWSNGGTWTR